MITAEQARRALLSMPVMEAMPEAGYQEFRVRDKSFARLWSGAGFANLKVGKEEQFMLSSQVKIYSIPKSGERGGWISVKLDMVNEEEFLGVVWKAWRHTAGPRLALQY